MVGAVSTDSLTLTPPIPVATGADQRFAHLLGAQSSGGRASEMSEDSATEAARDLVAMTLVQPVLASLRDSSMAAEPFKPGIAERRFGPLLDAEIARQLVTARGFGLVEAVARNLRGSTMEVRADGDAHASEFDRIA
jgi:Rod binding domain-containing protein